MTKAASLLSLLVLLFAAGCAATPGGVSAGRGAVGEVSRRGPAPGDEQDIAGLTQGLLALGPGIDAEEAGRAARIAIEYTYQLALEYQITDPPLIHNMKVNFGLRPRGLCYQWADDIEARLRLENFKTLKLHRAIANADNPFRIDHSTVIISAPGGTMFEGMVVDPWRKGGELFWSPTLADTDYKWVPRDVVFERKLRRRGAQERIARAG